MHVSALSFPAARARNSSATTRLTSKGWNNSNENRKTSKQRGRVSVVGVGWSGGGGSVISAKLAFILHRIHSRANFIVVPALRISVICKSQHRKKVAENKTCLHVKFRLFFCFPVHATFALFVLRSTKASIYSNRAFRFYAICRRGKC